MRKIYINTIAFLIILIFNAQSAFGQGDLCSTIGNSPDQTLSGNIGGDIQYTGQNIFITADLTLSGGVSVSFIDCNVLVAPGVIITVNPLSRLNIWGSHFFGCEYQWQGIEVLGNGATMGVVNIGAHYQSSLIEDAHIAIRFISHNTPCSGYFNLNVENTIFNKNYISIQLENITDDNKKVYPFYIKGNIFTCRDIACTQTYWPSVSILKNGVVNTCTIGPNSMTPFTMTAPYIDNDNYPTSSQKTYLGYSGANPIYISYPTGGSTRGGSYAGIVLIDCQANNFNGVTVGQADFNPETNVDLLPPDEYSIGLGENSLNPNMNIFDYHAYGIQAIASNLISYNNSFQNPGVTNIETYGIYTESEGNLLNVVSPNNNNGQPFNNAFWNMMVAVKSQGDFDLKVNNCDMRCDPIFKYVDMHCITLANNIVSCSSTSNTGLNGILANSGNFDGVQMSGNQIFNIENSINYSALWGDTFGSINADSNTIGADIFAVNPLGRYEMTNGIQLTQVGTPTHYKWWLNCNSNYMNPNNIPNFHGIQIDGWQDKDCKIRDNNLETVDYGIKVTNCSATNQMHYDRGDLVYNNTIDFGHIAIEVDYSNNVQVRCNTMTNEIDNVLYSNQSTASRCWGNKFYSCQLMYHALYLSSSVIGKQGDETSTGYPSDNQWLLSPGGGAYWFNNTTKFMTYCSFGSDATLSPLVVRDVTNYNPDGYSGADGYSPGFYAYGSGSILYAAEQEQYPDICNLTTNGGILDVTPRLPLMQRGGSNASNAPSINSANIDTAMYNNLQLAEALAQGQIHIPTSDSAERIYTMQQQLYLTLLYDTLLLNKSSILQNFMQSHEYDGYSWVNLMDWVAANKDTTTLSWILNNWQPNNNAEQNSLNYYGWVYKVQTKQTITSQDSTNLYKLASACPNTDGNSVYKARNLYHQLNKHYVLFTDQCAVTAPTQRKAIMPIISGIAVYPNPTKGTVNIKLPSNVDGLWTIRAIDMLGNTLLENKAATNNATINLNGRPGLYSLLITNNKTGAQSIQKIEIQ